MARKPRLDVEGGLYHVCGRGIERGRIFLDDEDRRDFLIRLRIIAGESGVQCPAWCLMPNHFHLVLVRGARPLAGMMRRLLTGYAIRFNLKYERAGHLFQNRYKSLLCDGERYFLQLISYVNLNPLRACLVKGVEELGRYAWCGHGALLGLADDIFMSRRLILPHFGATAGEAVRNYERFILDKAGEPGVGRFDAKVFPAAGSRDERIAGDEAFVARVLPGGGGAAPILRSREELLAAVARATGARMEEIFSRGKGRRAAEGRALYCYLGREGGWSGVKLAEELGVSGGAVSQLARRGEAAYARLRELKN